MKSKSAKPAKHRLLAITFALMAAVLFATPGAGAFTLNVVGSNGDPVPSFRWIVEEDAMYDVTPGLISANIPSVNFHPSYMPLTASGDETTTTITVPCGKRYFVSVLPDADFSIGGAPVLDCNGTVTVVVNAQPIPTAQISVLVFEDNHPTNNAPDTPQESGLAGFTVIVEDAGGRYGMAGGRVMTDAFGNMIGTVYEEDVDGNVVFNPDGSPKVLTAGTMSVTTDANGEALIKYLPPGKYGVVVIPPSGQGWQQVTTIEGTPVTDAWVKANEPSFFQEFGTPGYHVFVGFVRPTVDAAVLTGGATITGRVVNLHNSRPPDTRFWPGEPRPSAWVALNSEGGLGPVVYAQPCDPSAGTFSIANVPPGNYEVVLWDKYLDNIIAFHKITIAEGDTTRALGDIPVFQWFTRLQQHVFYDTNKNGFRDPGEVGIPNMGTNIRWRDGSVYQSTPTDSMGEAPFDQAFPFFHWMVAEVDFGRFKATGATVVVDGGGEINPLDPWSFDGILSPQPQPENGGAPYRVETGPVLLQAFQGFMGQTNVIEWGKAAYGPNENGGISGIVYYAITRAEDDPRYAVAEAWEPGIPRVQVNLYADGDIDNPPTGNFLGPEDVDWNHNGTLELPDGIIDDVNGNGAVTLADVDNHPLGWSRGGAKGAEDIDRNGNGVFDGGDAINIVWTDSWDDNRPTGCPGDPFFVHGVPTDCFDGLRNFNQVRPGVFDGGYAFNGYLPDGFGGARAETNGLPPGIYVVESVAPPNYITLKAEDKNVDFGDTFTPNPQLVPPVCVGDEYLVPNETSLFPGVTPLLAGTLVRKCDKKLVALENGMNAAADFFLFTQVPIAAHVVGFVLDDLSNEYDPNSPSFGEKYAPPWLPVSFVDFRGHEIQRVYTDEWGKYNTLLPSTYTTNVPSPSGMSPAMLTVCINSPIMPDPNNPGATIADPFYNPQYSQFCYTFQYMPGTTTYLDTPVLPIAAFAGPSQFPLDCSPPDQTPVIREVNGPDGGPVATTGQAITITSMGFSKVANPAYDGPNGKNPKLVFRDFGFGAEPGVVKVGEVPLENVTWTQGHITGTLPAHAVTGQLAITRSNGISTPIGITVHVNFAGTVHKVDATHTIQQRIDGAADGDMVLIPPNGSQPYQEMVILYKDIILQGYGPGSIINAAKIPAEKLVTWRNKVTALANAGAFDILPGQALPAGGPGIQAPVFANAEGAGITVLGTEAQTYSHIQIDGLTITGADSGGGIFVNGFVENLTISNTGISGNQGQFSGGIRVGDPQLIFADAFVDGQNTDMTIDHNYITQNGGVGGAGGGISLYTGTDGYTVSHNIICGNFTSGDGGGIGHLGLSTDGRIEQNLIRFNQSFSQGTQVSGGGIAIMGQAPLNAAGRTEGAGSVFINANAINGNLAGAGDGGGICLRFINGDDVAATPANPNNWYAVDLFNNLITNNVAGLAGGALSLQDATKVRLIHNTIAYNDSTATAGAAFVNANTSAPQTGGIISRKHSAALLSALGGLVDDSSIGVAIPHSFYTSFSNPEIYNSIIRMNRSFYFSTAANGNQGGLVPEPGQAPVYKDMEVVGFAGTLAPAYCAVTDVTAQGGSNNTSVDPGFFSAYVNTDKEHLIIPEVTTGIQAFPAFDEGGNFIDVRFGPLTWQGDYHLPLGGPVTKIASSALNVGFGPLLMDLDGVTRDALLPDIGAYQAVQAFPTPLSPTPEPVVQPTPGTDTATGAGVVAASGTRGATSSSSSNCFIQASAHTQKNAAWSRSDVTTCLMILALAILAATGTATRRRRAMNSTTWALMVGLAIALAVIAPLPPAHAAVVIQCPDDTDGVDTDGDGIVDNDNVCFHVGAGDGFTTMADGTELYTFGFSDLTGVAAGDAIMAGMLQATFPAPTLVVREGQKLYLTLTNVGMIMRPDLPDPHTIHFHGFPQAASIFDGVPDASISVNMGSSFTYFYNLVAPGTFMWHCHVEATEHMQMGMLGTIYVQPMQNQLADATDLSGFTHHTGYQYAYNDGDGSTYYDVDFPLQLSGFDPDFHNANEIIQPLPFALMVDRYPMINGRGYPDTVNPAALSNGQTPSVESRPMSSLIEAAQGKKILLRLSSLSTTRFHTITSLGIPMRVVGQGGSILRGPTGQDLSYTTTSVTLGGGEAKDVILDTAGLNVGTYYLYTTNLDALANDADDFGGMMTEIHILPPAP